MTAIFRPEGRLFRATGHARGLWSGYAAGQRNHRAEDARGRTDGKFVLFRHPTTTDAYARAISGRCRFRN